MFHGHKYFKTLALAASVVAATGFASVAALAADDVNVRFSWKLKGEYGFFYYGQDLGLYDKEDISLRLGEGAGSQAALGALTLGQEDIVILPAIFAISAIQKGMPVKIVAMYQPAAPIALISHPENPITIPKDLEGKKIAHAVGETGTSYLGVFCAINDVDCDSISKVQMDSQSRVPQFLQNQVDAVSVYLTNDLPILEARTGVEYPRLDLVEFGLRVPGMAAVASVDGIAKRPDVIRRFLAATAGSLAATAADPAAATTALAKTWGGGPSADIVQKQIEATTASIEHTEGKPVGWIDEAMIDAALDLLDSQEPIGDRRALADFYSNDLLTQ